MKPLRGIVFLIVCALLVSVIWARFFPSIFNTAMNQELLDKARQTINVVAPLNKGDKLLSETIYNHGGQIGIGRTYSSSVAMQESELMFSSLAKNQADGKKSRRRAYCRGGMQVGFDIIGAESSYYIYAVADPTASRPLVCP